MRVFALLLLAASALHFAIADGRGKRVSGVVLEASQPDADDWYLLTIAKAKGNPILIWPYDGRAKAPDGPEPIPAIVVEPGDRAARNTRASAALAAASLLGVTHPGLAFDADALAASEDPFAKGVGLLYAHKAAEAADPLARALRERERQLTRVPSEIYPAAMLYGRALFESGKFDDAAVAYLKALHQRPSDAAARKARAESLMRAGKPEAARGLLER